MKMKTLWKKISLFLMAFVFTFAVKDLIDPIDVHAADKTGSITFEFEGIADAEFRLYKVATPNSSGSFDLTGDFAGYSVNLSSTTAAETLQYYVERDNLTPLATKKTDSTGKIVYSELEPGVYLILGDRFERDNKIYTPQPVLLSVPGKNPDGNQPLWDVTVHAKYSECQKPEKPKKDITVLKIWLDKDKTTRPESIVVQLMKNGVVVEEVTLNAANNWKYTWKDLDAFAYWSVVEKVVPEGYHVAVSKQNLFNMFIIANTKCTPPEEGTTEQRPTTEGTTEQRPTTEGTTEQRPTTESTTEQRPTTEGTTEQRPTTESTTEQGATTEATTEGTTEEGATTEATTEGTTEEGPTTEATTEGTTEEGPATEVTTEGTTEDQPDTEATTGDSDSTTTEKKGGTGGKTTPPGPGSTSHKLPQTGQLWWPVSILLCAGMLCIIIGVRVGRKKEEE